MDTISDNTAGQKPTLGSVERAYADGYAAAQHEIERLRTALEEMLEAFSMENIGIEASKRRLEAKKCAREALEK